MNFSKNRINQILFLAIIIFAIIAGWSVSELFKKEDSSNDIRVNFNSTNHLGAKVSEKDYQKYSKVFFFLSSVNLIIHVFSYHFFMCRNADHI